MIPQDYRTSITPTWCPGCGNFLVYAALQKNLADRRVPTHNLVVTYDIGCAGNMADFIKSYGIHTLHGRAIPVALGIKMVRPDLTVLVIGGDGGIYGEGLNHLVAAARLNSDIKVFVSNNYLYSLTTGQASPTTPKGAKTKSTPLGVPSTPIDAVTLLKNINPKVFAQSIDARDVPSLQKAVAAALKRPGFALLEVRQQCVAFGKQLSAG